MVSSDPRLPVGGLETELHGQSPTIHLATGPRRNLNVRLLQSVQSGCRGNDAIVPAPALDSPAHMCYRSPMAKADNLGSVIPAEAGIHPPLRPPSPLRLRPSPTAVSHFVAAMALNVAPMSLNVALMSQSFR